MENDKHAIVIRRCADKISRLRLILIFEMERGRTGKVGK
jgi:hypothetical protein